MSKSGLKMPPCKLLLLADGLPTLPWSKFMIPSLLFNGLDLAPQLPYPLSKRAVPRGAEKGLFCKDGALGLKNPLPGEALSGLGLRCIWITFSWSSLEPADDWGVTFPELVESCSVLLRGLRGIVVDRGGLRIGLSLRGADRAFRAVCGAGVANAVGVVDCRGGKMPAEIDRGDSLSRGGDKGELGEGEADLDVTKRKAGVFDGERERERRSCLKAEAGST